MDSSSLSSPSYLSLNLKYHVFPSFHGADVRKAFLSHILKEFRSKGIDPFLDYDIERSKAIGPELIEAIKGSKIALVLLSINYASSTWCLNELVEIIKCKDELDQTVLTIFFEVDPTDVKKQTGDFGRIFSETCAGKTMEDIRRWRQALAKVATIAGYHSTNWENEAVMIEKITSDISNKLNDSTTSNDFDGLVGMRAHMNMMEPLLCLDLNEVRMMGIWGPAGIGKTTIARFLFNQHSNNFQLSVFMENIKESYTMQTCSDDYSEKLHLHQHLMSRITNQNDIKSSHLGVVHERLKEKKVLVVFDDVNRSVQLDAMAKESWWFGSGSRIIITTQDKKILKAHGISDIYKVDYPSTNDALQIFCTYAFGQNFPKDGFMDLAKEVTKIVGELPLGLRVMGSYLRRMSKQEWENALPRLRNSLDPCIQKILKFSYDALDDEDKDLFLHIACFFNPERIESLEAHLAKSFLNVRLGLDILAEKSFISINSGYIEMHNLIALLGREIVRKQYIREPGQRQFLVHPRDIAEVLSDDRVGTRSVIGIDLNLFEIDDELTISERAFEGMTSLKFLRFYGDLIHFKKLHLPRGLNYISRKLTLLDWAHFPMPYLPSNFNPEFLVELIMCHSNLEKLWEGVQPLRNLKWMNMRSSRYLKELPDLSTATSLKDLDLSNCSSLVELPSSIGKAINLKMFDLSGCSSLVKLPSSVGSISNLHILDLSGCSNLVELPSSIGNATTLEQLDLRNCSSLVELPSSIGNVTNLQMLDINNCSSLVKLPSSIGNATNLKVLKLVNCSSLVELPFSIGSVITLEQLDLKNCSSLVELPSAIVNAYNLKIMDLSDCSNLLSLPSTIENAINLKVLKLVNCSRLVELPSSIGNTVNLEELDLSNCSSLQDLPYSIGSATNLRYLYLCNCSSLVKLPSSIGNVSNLQILDLSNCLSLAELPYFIGNATNLEELKLVNCSSLMELPFSIGNATNLQKLYLNMCTSLVELPCSIGELHNLLYLSLEGCSKLEVFPININMVCLVELDLTNCLLIKSFPEISTNIKHLKLIGTAIEEVPSTIKFWPRLSSLHMTYCENLKEFPQARDTITELLLSDTEIKMVSPWVKKISRLHRLVLNGCRKLVALPQLPDSLSIIYAENCESLERLDCSFHNPDIYLKFVNCFKLNQEARNLIIQTSACRHAVLPGGKVPTYFTYRASGGSLSVKLSKRPQSTLLRFKACILPINNVDDEDNYGKEMPVYFHIIDKFNNPVLPSGPGYTFLYPLLIEHLYIFEVEAEVTSNELVFEFKLYFEKWKIKECGIHVDEHEESF